MTDPVSKTISSDGLEVRYLDWGGDDATERARLLFVHANGMCAGWFDPLAQRLANRFHCAAIDLRGHGASDAPSERAGFEWNRLGGDVLAVLDDLKWHGVAGVGVSMGSSALTFADQERPGCFDRLLLTEAVAVEFPPGHGEDNSMSEGARRRRDVWPDRASMVERYRNTIPLGELAPEALEAYVRWGTHERTDGQVALSCAPETEAMNFEMGGEPTGAVAALANFDKLHANHVTIAGGNAESAFPQEWTQAQADLAGVERIGLPGGHFALLEDLEAATELITKHLAP